MLKKWFKRAFPEIEKISQTLAPKLCQKLHKIEHLMKRCIGSAKPHRSVFRFFARLRCWRSDSSSAFPDREDILNSGPKAMPKIMKNWNFNENGYRIRKTSQKRFSPFLQDITMLKKWFISAFPEIEIYLKLWYLKLWPQSYAKNYDADDSKFPEEDISYSDFNEKVLSDPQNLTEVFRFFARYYDAEEVIHKRKIDISNSGPKATPKIIIITWTFNEKVHRIRKTSQSRFSLFCKILWCWRSDS